MGVALTVNVKAVEGRNISNVCVLKQSQKPYFMFYYVLLLVFFICILTFVMLNYLSFLLWNSSDPKEQN